MKDMKDVADEIINSGTVEYFEVYEEALNNILRKQTTTGKNTLAFSYHKRLKDTLKEKREFGIKKYGDNSFQSSFEKSVLSPVVEHLMSEIIDAMNYSLHALFVADVKGYDRESFETIFDDLLKIYKKIIMPR